MQELETKRLLLRPLTAADRDALYAIYAEPEVSERLITQPKSMEEFRLPFDQMLELSSTLGMWVIVHRDEDRIIGRCGFYPLSEPPVGTPELAYLLSRACWGQGLATEAARGCLDYSFFRQKWSKVVAMVRVGNSASLRVLTKLGMTFCRQVEVRGVAADLYSVERTSYSSSEPQQKP